MNYLDITYPDINNGLGLRVTLWLSGCSHHCDGCHNPQTWDETNGYKFDDEAKQYLFHVLNHPYIRGVTFSGGDPLFESNREEVLKLILELKEKYPDKDIWLYTGYTYEEITEDESMYKILKHLDVLIEGVFVLKLRDITLPFKGSPNQRIINVTKSLQQNKIVLLEGLT